MDLVTTESNAQLAVRAQAGDRAAFGVLVERHWVPLVRVARSVVGEADAEDVVQDALVMAWQKLSSLRRPEAFRSWLQRAVVRRCLRQARRWPSPVSLETASEPTADSDPKPEMRVRWLLQKLAPRQRAVMHLTLVEGCSDSEIGDLLGISASSVRVHRWRARRHLEALWNGHPRP